MLISEAVLLIFQATVIGKGGEVLVLDMGEPINIKDLAESLIRLNHLEPYKDIDIVFTGLRPGEKISEELFTTEEESVMTSHRKIYIANKQSKLNDIELKNIISRLYKFLDNPEKLKSILREYISFN